MIKFLKLAFVLVIFTLFNFFVFSKNNIEIKDINLKKNINQGEFFIDLKEKIKENPILEVRGNILQLTLPETFVWPKIEKSVSLSKKLDTKILAYQFDKETVRFRAILPYSLKDRESNIKISSRNKRIHVIFPIVNFGEKKLSDFDESYLDKLIKDQNLEKRIDVEYDELTSKNDKNEYSDKVESVTSGRDKENASAFSIWIYLAKAGLFLILILLFFYGAINLMRRGILKKGKLGFFNGNSIIEILSTSYLGPKRSLVLIKIHKQVFLVSNTDKGINILSEIKDAANFIKDREFQVSGTNFDSNLKDAKNENKDFNLKEVLQNPNQESLNKDLINPKSNEIIKDEVKLSDQIKNKVKELKSLQ